MLNRRQMLIAGALVPVSGISVLSQAAIKEDLNSFPKTLIHNNKKFFYETEIEICEQKKYAIYFRDEVGRPTLLERETYQPYYPLEDVKMRIRIGLDKDGNVVSRPTLILPNQNIVGIKIESMSLNETIKEYIGEFMPTAEHIDAIKNGDYEQKQWMKAIYPDAKVVSTGEQKQWIVE